MVVAQEVQAVDPVFADEPAPFDESELLSVAPLTARDIAAKLPLDTRFQLRDDITPVQWAFLQEHGFLVFARVASPEEVATILSEVDRMQAKFLAEGIEKIHGVPIWYGCDDEGEPGFSEWASPRSTPTGSRPSSPAHASSRSAD